LNDITDQKKAIKEIEVKEFPSDTASPSRISDGTRYLKHAESV